LSVTHRTFHHHHYRYSLPFRGHHARQRFIQLKNSLQNEKDLKSEKLRQEWKNLETLKIKEHRESIKRQHDDDDKDASGEKSSSVIPSSQNSSSGPSQTESKKETKENDENDHLSPPVDADSPVDDPPVSPAEVTNKKDEFTKEGKEFSSS
jgi:hypothetical protein